MMTQMQPTGHTCSFAPWLTLNPMESIASDPSRRDGGGCRRFFSADGDVAQRPCQADSGPYQSPAKTPFWPSLTAVRTAMENRHSWKRELEKAVRRRSFIISAAMVSLIVLGIIAV